MLHQNAGSSKFLYYLLCGWLKVKFGNLLGAAEGGRHHTITTHAFCQRFEQCIRSNAQLMEHRK